MMPVRSSPSTKFRGHLSALSWGTGGITICSLVGLQVRAFDLLNYQAFSLFILPLVGIRVGKYSTDCFSVTVPPVVGAHRVANASFPMSHICSTLPTFKAQASKLVYC